MRECKWIFNGIFLYLSVIYMTGLLFSVMQVNTINSACVSISAGGFSATQIGEVRTKYEKFHFGACILFSVFAFIIIFVDPNKTIPSWSSAFLVAAMLINIMSLL